MRRHLLLISILFLLLFPVGVAAQTSTPVPQVFDRWEAFAYFPEAALFELDLDLPDETTLLSVDLRVQSDTLGIINIPMDLENDEVTTIDRDQVRVSFLLDFQTLPLAFETVEYRWTVQTSDELTEFVDGEFIFEDQRQSWERGESETIPFVLYVGENGASPDSIFGALQPVYERLQANTETAPETLSVVIYGDNLSPTCDVNEDDEPFIVHPDLERTIPCTEAAYQAIYERAGLTLFDVPASSSFAAQRALVPNLGSRMYAPLWAGDNVPAWFQFGVIQSYQDVSQNAALLSPALVASRNGQLFTLEDLGNVPEAGTRAYDVWEAQSYGMVVYIAQQFGFDTLYTLAREVGDYPTLAAAYESLTGESLDALVSQWEVWIFTDEAPTVYGLDIYGPPTPTVTPVLSATPAPPTPVPSETPVPTETPTFVPTSPPDTATPPPTLVVPSAQQPQNSDPDMSVTLNDETRLGLQVMFLGLAGLSVLLMVLGVVIRRRG